MKRVLLSALTLLCGIGSWSMAWAAIPHLVRYQGTLADTQNVALEGPYTLTFRIYDVATGGTKLWEETQTNVPITKGQFSVLLGQVTPLDLPFDKDLWLSIEVNSDGEMAPRQRLSSVPYAYRAEVAENTKTSVIQDDAYRFMPSGIIVLSPGPSCPSGYTRFASMDGKFLVAGATFNAAAGGSNTHTHDAGSYTGPSHTHSIMHTHTVGQAPENGRPGYIWPNDKYFTTSGPNPAISGVDGARPITGISAPADSRPEFATVLLCQKN